MTIAKFKEYLSQFDESSEILWDEYNGGGSGICKLDVTTHIRVVEEEGKTFIIIGHESDDEQTKETCASIIKKQITFYECAEKLQSKNGKNGIESIENYCNFILRERNKLYGKTFSHVYYEYDHAVIKVYEYLQSQMDDIIIPYTKILEKLEKNN